MMMILRDDKLDLINLFSIQIKSIFIIIIIYWPILARIGSCVYISPPPFFRCVCECVFKVDRTEDDLE